jgi:hypothetical protein
LLHRRPEPQEGRSPSRACLNRGRGYLNGP